MQSLQRYALWLYILGALGLAQSIFLSVVLMLTPVGDWLARLVQRLIHAEPAVMRQAMDATNLLFLAGLVVFPLVLASGWALKQGRERWVVVTGAALMLSPIGTVYLWPATLPLGVHLLNKLTADQPPGRMALERLAIVLGLGGVLGLAWSAFVLRVALDQPGEAGARVVIFGLIALNAAMAGLWIFAAALCWQAKARGLVLGILGASFVPCRCGFIATAPLAIWAIVVLRRPQVKELFA